MPDAPQSLLERITDALLGSWGGAWDRDAAEMDARTVLGVLGERDAEIRQHLEAIRDDDSDDDDFAYMQAVAALRLLGPADTQEDT